MWHEVLYVFDGNGDALRLKARLLAFLAARGMPHVIESYYDGVSSDASPEDAEASIVGDEDALPVVIYCDTLHDAEALAQAVAGFDGTLPVARIKPLPAYAAENAWSEAGTFRTKRFVLSPDPNAEVVPGQFLIQLRPGDAFGSGQHVTTIAMLRALEEAAAQPRRVLDIGTGNGVLLIAAARLGAHVFVGTDLTEEIIAEARQNLALNHVTGHLIVSDQIPAPADDAQRFDLVMANIPVSALRPLMPRMIQAASARGKILLSGFNASDGQAFSAELRGLGLHCVSETEERGWVALLFAKG